MATKNRMNLIASGMLVVLAIVHIIHPLIGYFYYIERTPAKSADAVVSICCNLSVAIPFLAWSAARVANGRSVIFALSVVVFLCINWLVVVAIVLGNQRSWANWIWAYELAYLGLLVATLVILCVLEFRGDRPPKGGNG